MGRWWSTVNVSLRVRLHVFKAICLTTLFSGIEAQCCNNYGLRLLEKWQMKHLRRLCCGHAYRLSDNQLRALLRTPTVRTQLMVKRLHWLQRMAEAPTDHELLFTALLAPSGALQIPQLAPSGLENSYSNPWLLQWLGDLRELAAVDPVFMHEFETLGFRAIWSQAFRSSKPRKLLSDHQATATHDAPPRPVYSVCPLSSVQPLACQLSYPTLQALVLHLRRNRGLYNVLRTAVVTNQCPWCRRTFTTINGARSHTRIRQKHGSCPLRTGGCLHREWQPRQPDNMACPFCKQQFMTLQALQDHIVQHIANLDDETVLVHRSHELFDPHPSTTWASGSDSDSSSNVSA